MPKPRPINVSVNLSPLDNLDVLALIAIAARLISDWDYSLGVYHLPTWVGPNGEAEAMSSREVKIVRLILADLDGKAQRAVIKPGFDVRPSGLGD